VSSPADLGHAIGMTVALSWLDAEAASDELAGLGFTAVELHLAQLTPALPGAIASEAQAAAFGRMLSERGLVPSSLNAAGAPGFEPISGSWEGAVDALAGQLRIAHAIGAPRVICWDGRPAALGDTRDAPARLVEAIVEAQRRSGVEDPPAVSVELHPFTFALACGLLEETATALHTVKAGLCIDFCHFAVALGAGFMEALTPAVVDATNHIHLADSDCVTSELHFPLGEGVLDVAQLLSVFKRRSVSLAWDLFGWPAPRLAMRRGLDRYREIVDAHARELEVLS
jgi:sugar phosphate isomerase/epimerase